jgi:hypothetical protein
MKNPYAVAQTKLGNLQARLQNGDQQLDSAMRGLVDIMHEFIRYAGEREQHLRKEIDSLAATVASLKGQMQ